MILTEASLQRHILKIFKRIAFLAQKRDNTRISSTLLNTPYADINIPDAAHCFRCDGFSEGGCDGKERDQLREIISHLKITYVVKSICDTVQVN